MMDRAVSANRRRRAAWVARWVTVVLAGGTAFVATIGVAVAARGLGAIADPFVIVLGVASLTPFALYVAYVRGFWVSLISGVLLIAWSAYAYLEFFRSGSSTAPLMLYGAPIPNYAVACLAIGVDNAYRIWRDFIRRPGSAAK